MKKKLEQDIEYHYDYGDSASFENTLNWKNREGGWRLHSFVIHENKYYSIMFREKNITKKKWYHFLKLSLLLLLFPVMLISVCSAQKKNPYIRQYVRVEDDQYTGLGEPTGNFRLVTQAMGRGCISFDKINGLDYYLFESCLGYNTEKRGCFYFIEKQAKIEYAKALAYRKKEEEAENLMIKKREKIDSLEKALQKIIDK